MQLLERAEALARIAALGTEARMGQGGMVIVEGPAGIGKTAVLKAAGAEATGAGMRLLRASGADLERDFSFGVVGQLFVPALADESDDEQRALLDGAAGLAAGVLGLPGGAPIGDGTGSPSDPAFAVLNGLYWLCVGLSSRRPLWVVVDDAHWADVAVASLSGLLVAPVGRATRCGRACYP